MEEHGASVRRIINGGGIPQKNETLNQVYANVLNKPILVPQGDVTSLGSAIFAFLAAGAFPSLEAAQKALCPPHQTYLPEPTSVEVYNQLFALYRKMYFSLGKQGQRGTFPSVMCCRNSASSPPAYEHNHEPQATCAKKSLKQIWRSSDAASSYIRSATPAATTAKAAWSPSSPAAFRIPISSRKTWSSPMSMAS